MPEMGGEGNGLDGPWRVVRAAGKEVTLDVRCNTECQRSCVLDQLASTLSRCSL